VAIPVKLRFILGRARFALNYALGRQAMAKSVTSYDDDVWIVSYPKSGNTWTRFLIANLIAGGETVDWTNIERLVPDIYYNHDPALRSLPRPRYFKSHEAYRPSYRRVVLIVRDPRDVAVSYYHFVRKAKMMPADATVNDFMKKFLAGDIDPYGNWGENVGSWLGARRGTADFIVVRYEDLLENAEAELARLAEMLGLAVDDNLLRHAVENSRADRMRELEKAQRGEHKILRSSGANIPFVRAAKSGQWRTELPPEAVRQIESTWGHVMHELGYIESPVMEAVR
jgi:Sulfotransferase domain